MQPPAHSEVLPRLLREITNSPVLGQRCPDFSPGSAAIVWKGDRNTTGRRLASSLLTAGSLKRLRVNVRMRILDCGRSSSGAWAATFDSSRRVDLEKSDLAFTIFGLILPN